MKFQKLTIHNIASIEDVTIDFEAQPLSNCDVFLITGKTGAGKSTILDAICLALYANTPRLSNTKMQGEVKDMNNEIQIDDPRQLMRKHCGEAFVTLTFKGSNSISYEATWSVRRARNNANGNLQSKNWQLKNLDADTIFTKDADIKAEIQRAIGLDFKQFCRTTMLAQGEFTRFLNSNDTDKSEILEKITGVDIYSKIGAKIFAITSDKKNIWEQAESIKNGTTTLSEDEIIIKRNEINQLEIKNKNLSTEKETISTKQNWINKRSELISKIKKSQDELDNATKTIESEEFKQKANFVSDWKTTINARKYLVDMQNAEKQENTYKNTLNKLAEKYAILLNGKKYDEQEKKEIESKIDTISAELKQEKEKEIVYINSQIIITKLKTIIESQELIKEKSKEIKDQKDQLKNILTPNLEYAHNQTQTTETQYKADKETLELQEKNLEKINLQALHQEQIKINSLLANINLAKTKITNLENEKTRREKDEKSLNKLKIAIDDKIKQLNEITPLIHDTKTKMDDRKQLYEAQKDSVDKFAANIRTKLHKGDQCPVCRQIIEINIPKEEELTQLVVGLKNAYEEAKTEYETLVNEQTKLNSEIKTETHIYNTNYQEFTQNNTVDQAYKDALDACILCGIEAITDDILVQIDDLTTKNKKINDQLKVKIEDGENIETIVRNIRKKIETDQKKIEKLKLEEQKASQAINDCENNIKSIESIIDIKEKEIETAQTNLKQLIVENWEINWQESPTDFINLLQSATQTYNTKLKQLDTFTSKLNNITTCIDEVTNILNYIINDIQEWKTIEAKEITQCRNIKDEADNLKTQVTKIITQLDNAKNQYKTNANLLNIFLTNNPSINIDRLICLNNHSNIEKEEDYINSNTILVSNKKELLKVSQQQLNEHQQHKPNNLEEKEETLDFLNNSIDKLNQQINEINERIGAIKQELTADEENRKHLGKLIEDAEKKKLEYKKWHNLNQIIGDAKGNKFRKIAQSYVLSNLIHSANSYMKTLSDRYTLKVIPGTFIISLEDAYQGYTSRAASTISGGESFLVSLSLALALSNIGQTLSADTLFIDEGFGTLSGEPLQNAINTLRSLHHKAGRHVGIISHVEELQERIPVQIQVNQENNSSSSKIKIIPEIF